MEKEKSDNGKEAKREIALKNLKSSNLMNIAASYIVNENKQFGEADNSAMEQFKYFPSFNSGTKAYSADGKEYDLIKEAILNSRESGQRYSGNISERKIMKDCAAIMNESLSSIKIKDMLVLMGSKAEISEEYQNMYIGDLVPKMSKEDAKSLNDEDKKKIKNQAELYQNLIGSYQTFLTQKMVSESLWESSKQVTKNLETILMGDQEDKTGK